MKLNPFLFTMMALLCTAMMAQGQKPAYPTTLSDQILFYKKLSAASRNNSNHIPQMRFDKKMESTAYTSTLDTATKRFRCIYSGQASHGIPTDSSINRKHKT